VTAVPDPLTTTWWVLLTRGALAIIFGIVALVWPGMTILALVILFGAYAVVNGIFTLIGGFRGVPGQSRGWLIFSGIISVLAGIVALVWPGISALALLFVIAAWFVVTGVFEIIGGIAMRKQIDGEWLLILGGVLSVVFGVLLFIWPGQSALALTWLIGIFAIVFGIALIFLAFRVKKFGASASYGGTAPVV
jgi:uncharacterized membrane protein HdeD (DUF308 family)